MPRLLCQGEKGTEQGRETERRREMRKNEGELNIDEWRPGRKGRRKSARLNDAGDEEGERKCDMRRDYGDERAGRLEVFAEFAQCVAGTNNNNDNTNSTTGAQTHFSTHTPKNSRGVVEENRNVLRVYPLHSFLPPLPFWHFLPRLYFIPSSPPFLIVTRSLSLTSLTSHSSLLLLSCPFPQFPFITSCK